MTDYMAHSLELLPHPAAIFSSPEAQFIYANELGLKFTREHFQSLARRLETKKLVTTAIENGTYDLALEGGYLHMSMLPTSPVLSRPDLLLATFHENVDAYAALCDHRRMVLVLKVNESGEIALRTLENVLLQTQAALSAQHDLLNSYNARVSEFWGDTPRKTAG